MRYIKRAISKKIQNRLFENKAIIVLGPRQVGKTTMIKQILKKQTSILYLNGDDADIRDLLANTTSTKLKNIIGNNNIIFIDEAQRIENIGITLKIIIDQISNVQVIATGSSSLELCSKINEPLTGRKYEYYLHPLSFGEMVGHHGLLEENRLLEDRLLYGYYPEIVTQLGNKKEELLRLLADSYLYKDILMLGDIKKPALLNKILKALALQIGNEVSFNEIGQLVGSGSQTIEKYIDLLEKSFVIFQLPAYSGNVRNEIRKGKKIYFYDTGIRNAIIGNFSRLNQRTDVGALWENFLIAERVKSLAIKSIKAESYFWRTTQQQEIDYIEISSNTMEAYEFTWNPKTKKKISKTFMHAYQNCSAQIITSDNFNNFLI
jgi:predicted AAA+ superfamily ATPase